LKRSHHDYFKGAIWNADPLSRNCSSPLGEAVTGPLATHQVRVVSGKTPAITERLPDAFQPGGDTEVVLSSNQIHVSAAAGEFGELICFWRVARRMVRPRQRRPPE